MLSIANEHGRLAWLAHKLDGKRYRICALLHRITGLGHPGTLKPRLFAKFVHFMDEVAVAKVEEMHLIARIEAVEQRHRLLRLEHRLRMAGPMSSRRATSDNKDICPPERRAKTSSLWKALLFWYLFVAKK
ncbi:MAG: hypothetical protein AB7H77_06365 [Bdellovibrionales bacterium]